MVLECCATEYTTHAGRMSSFTGVPTLLAWDNSHEALWRSGQPLQYAEIPVRRKLVNAIYQGKDPDTNAALTPQRLLELLHGYRTTVSVDNKNVSVQFPRVDYLVVGATERGEAGAQGDPTEQLLAPGAEAIYQQALSEAFKSGSTVIYKVPQ